MYDLNRNDYQFIPNYVFDLVVKYNGFTKEKMILESPYTINEIEDAIALLEEHEYIFWCDKEEINLFPPLNKTWERPNLITNGIIDIPETITGQSLSTLLTCISNDVQCEYFVVRTFHHRNIAFWEEVLSSIHYSRIRSIQIIAPFFNDEFIQQIQELNSKYNRIQVFVLFNSTRTELISSTSGKKNIVLIDSAIEENINETGVSPYFFEVNIAAFTEAQHHHSFYNRKLCIDSKGQLYNGNTKEIFGTIQEVDLKEIISLPAFQNYWTASKDKTDVCKICEFRYMCVDNRVPVKRTDGTWYHKSDCKYNPYISKWQWEEGYKPLSQCGITINDTGLSQNQDVLNVVNQEIWGEDLA